MKGSEVSGLETEVTLRAGCGRAGSPSEGEQGSAPVSFPHFHFQLKPTEACTLWPSVCGAVWWSVCFRTSWVLRPELGRSWEALASQHSLHHTAWGFFLHL